MALAKRCLLSWSIVLGLLCLPGVESEWEAEQAEFIGTLQTSGLGIVRGNWHTGEVTEILADFTASTGGAKGVALDLEVDGTPREMLLGSFDKNIYTCPMNASAVEHCSKVGICTSDMPRAVEYDKDANGNVIGYFAACQALRYCDLEGTCTNFWSDSNNDNFAFKLELAVDGSTSAVLVSKWTSIWRCTYPGASCSRILGTAFAGNALNRLKYPRHLDYNDDGSGNILSYIVGDTGNGRVMFCYNGVDDCTKLKTDVNPEGVSVRKYSHGTTRDFWFANRKAAGNGGSLHRCELSPLACESMSIDNLFDIAMYTYYPVSTTSTTSRSTTSSTTLTTVTNTGSSSTLTTSTSTVTTITSSTSTKTTITSSTSTSSTMTRTSSTSTTSTATVTSSTSSTVTETSSTSTTQTRTTSTSSTSSSTATSTSTSTSSLTITTTGTTTAAPTDTRTTSATSTMSSTVTLITTLMVTTSGAAPSTSDQTTATSGTSSGMPATSAAAVGTSSGMPATSAAAVGSTRFSAYCFDERSFRDANGLICSDWSGYNCSDDDDDSYTEDELLDIQAACPMSCSLCPEDSMAVGATTPQTSIGSASVVSLTHSFNIGLEGVNESVQEQGFLKSYAELFQIPATSLQLTITSGSGDGRRLADTTTVRCEVVVSEATTLLAIVSAATSLATDSGSLNSFGSALSSETGVDTSSLSATVDSSPQVSSASVALDSAGNIVGIEDATGSSGTSVLTLETGCVDEVFLDEQGRLCSDWLGYSCTDAKWLTSSEPYTVAGLLEVQQHCLLSCQLCLPASRPSKQELQASCEDDEDSAEFCRRWRGMSCSAAASDFSFPEAYAETLLTLCPLSCGTCDSEADAPCSDTIGYADELGYSCEDWAGLSCTSLYTGYSELGMLHIQAYCPESCGFCSASFGTPRSELSLADGCEDDADFMIAGTFGCDFFVGKSCTYSDIFLEPRWLLGPAAVAKWHQELWSSCPVSCGVCEPDGRPTESDLFVECQDDAYVEDWCASNWEGTDCSAWESATQLGSASSASLFNATLFGRCPKSCGLCEEPVCQAGTYRDTLQHTCEECQAGSYAATARSGEEATSCNLARAGFYIEETGSTEESYCYFGTFSDTTGAPMCTDCPAGSFAGARGSSKCEACSPGFYADNVGMSVCDRCPFGYYQDGEGMSSCQACPETFTTLELGSNTSEACVCGEGTYLDGSSGHCVSCPRGFSCPGGANQVDQATGLDPTVLLAPGMMSLETNPFSAYSCITAEIACPGYRRPVWDDPSNPVCQDNSYGVRCGFCTDDFYLDEEEGCLACSATTGTFLGVVHLCGVTIILIACLYRTYVLVSRDDFPPKVIFWLAIAFIQFIIEIEGLPLKWPSMIVEVFKICNYFNIFELYDNFMSIHEECIFGSSASSRMLRDVLKPLLPAALFLPLAVLVRIATRRHLNIYFVVATIADSLLAVFVQVAVMVFYVFPTDEMPNGLLYLTYYPRIEHGSDDWVALLPCTAAAALFYVAGFLSFVVYGLWNLPRLYAHRTEHVEMFAFFGDYRPSMYWWTGALLFYEVCFALSNALVINPYVRVYLTMVFVICFAVLEIAWMPGLTRETQTASTAIQLGIATLLAVGTSWSWQDDEVDMEDYRHVVAVMIFALIISLVVVVACRLAVSLHDGRKSDDENRKALLSETLVWMRSGLSMPLGDSLRCVSDMDYRDNQLLRKWTLALRTNALRIAPKVKQSHFRTFASHVVSGHLLSYVHPSDAVTDLASTHDRRQHALQILQRWSSLRHGPTRSHETNEGEDLEPLPKVSSEVSARVPAPFSCKENRAFGLETLEYGVFAHAKTPPGSPGDTSEASERSTTSHKTTSTVEI